MSWRVRLSVRTHRKVLSLAVVVLLPWLSACESGAGEERDSSPSADESLPSGGLRGSSEAWGVEVHDAPLGLQYPFGGIDVCLAEGGAATIRSVTATKQTGSISISRVAIRDLEHGKASGLEPGKPLPAELVPLSELDVETKCSDHPFPAEIVVVVNRDASGYGTIEGLTATYEQDGELRQDSWPITLTLCDIAKPEGPCAQEQ